MRKESVGTKLSEVAFDFFYWFSRFEFALKENDYLKCRDVGARAEPNWEAFVEKWHARYTVSIEAIALQDAKPERQIVARNGELTWAPVRLDNCKSELEKVVRLLKTIRNNLFHGGKHGAAGWDDPKRAEFLLITGKAVLDQFARLAELDPDYTQYY